ncbi:hypothetical protein SS50377_21030 [Spironucleus salmonicida]|uniref:Uncharacterized protein n=1 Tax=Spironucleus salmonicida TaxID=348837 RepID=V6LJ37_9EUKA|nr:hypothetical protein SS50377_21030 [Spironucleus salmonicida]|eukprot:EST43691.1 hypothetical protein SS50377_16741 [Spironucleus salmonicida]
MQKAIPGVLYAGRFYADERAGSRPGVFKAKCPYKNSDIQNYWKLREYEREKIRSLHQVHRQTPSQHCESCVKSYQKPCIYQDTSPFMPFEKSNFNCFHCLKVLHLCRCECYCRTCQLAKRIGCLCPVCTCCCGVCNACKSKDRIEIIQQEQQLDFKRKMLEKFEDENLVNEMKINFKQTLFRLQQEKIRLQEALINVNTYEERAKIKHKLYLNENLIMDCQKLAGQRESTKQESKNIFLDEYNAPEKHPLQTTFFDENDFQIHQISPSSSSSNPQPSPPPIRQSSKKPTASPKYDSSLIKKKSSQLPEKLIQQQKHLFNKYAQSNFNSGADVIKILSPSFINPTPSDLSFQGEIIEPELIFGSKILRFGDHMDLYNKIQNVFSSIQITCFERNVVYALLSYYAFKQPQILLDFKQLNRNFPFQKIAFRLPFTQANGPPFCLIICENEPICNVAVPFFGDRAMLPKAKKCLKMGKFEIQCEFDDGKIIRGLRCLMLELGKYCSGLK